MGPKIPDRWIPYSACGAIIEGTRIICFKVPLHKSVQTDPEIKKIWDVPAVLAEIPKLGAVIDLTNTAKYYNPRDFETAGVLHRKILMPGREIPPETKVREFMDAVDEFQGKGCDSLIGVHCTHGLNRTGYMVCRYMRDRLNMPGEEAIRRFEVARGYKMEREIYLASLLNKKIPRPDFDFDPIDGQRSDDRENQTSKQKRKRKWLASQSNNRYEKQPKIDGQATENGANVKKLKLSKNQKRRLKNKIKKQQRLAKLQDSLVDPLENRATSLGDQIKTQGNPVKSIENQNKTLEKREKPQGNSDKPIENQFASLEPQVALGKKNESQAFRAVAQMVQILPVTNKHSVGISQGIEPRKKKEKPRDRPKKKRKIYNYQ